MASAYSKILGRKVRVMPVSDNMFLKAVLAAADEFGYNEFTAVQTVFYMQEFRLNRFSEGGPTDVVLQLTGREPEDFETIARHFIDSSPYKVKSLIGQIKALRKMMSIFFIKLPGKRAQAQLNVEEAPSVNFIDNYPSNAVIGM